MSSKKICFVLPTKNEEKTIKEVIEGIRAEVEGLSHEVLAIIVTDDSRDNTRSIAQQNEATVINGGGKGLGSAMFRGLKLALHYNPDIIVAMDADGQSEIKELRAFLQPILDNEADLVLGSRFKEEGLVKYHYRLKNRTGIRILVKILRWLTKIKLTDSHGGLRAMTTNVVKELEMIGTHTYVQETIIDAAEKGFRIKEIPSVWKERKNGKSRVVASIAIYTFYTLPVLILRSGQHIKGLFSLGIFFFLLAFLDFFVVGIQTDFDFRKMLDRQSFLMIILFISIGIQLLFSGFALELLSGIKRKIDHLDPDRF